MKPEGKHFGKAMENSRLPAWEDPAEKSEHDDKVMPIGLAENPANMAFQCATCEWFDSGTCRNPNKRLTGKQVKPEWCCNLYTNDDMKVVIR